MKIRHSGMRGGLVSGAHFEPTMSRHTAQEEAGNIAHQLSTVETGNCVRSVQYLADFHQFLTAF